MKSQCSAMAVILSAWSLVAGPLCYGDAEADARKRYADLKKQAETITAHSSPKEVSAALGEPLFKNIESWGRLNVDAWSYLTYTDDDEDLSFVVFFDPERGTSVSASRTLRSDVGVPQVIRGTVLQASRSRERELLCEVMWDDGRNATLSVNVSSRVTGEAVPGARIQVEHRGNMAGSYIFQGPYSLYLDAIHFTKAGDDVSSPAR